MTYTEQASLRHFFYILKVIHLSIFHSFYLHVPVYTVYNSHEKRYLWAFFTISSHEENLTLSTFQNIYLRAFSLSFHLDICPFYRTLKRKKIYLCAFSPFQVMRKIIDSPRDKSQKYSTLMPQL